MRNVHLYNFKILEKFQKGQVLNVNVEYPYFLSKHIHNASTLFNAGIHRKFPRNKLE